MTTLKVRIKGVRPLIMHSWEGIDELNPMVIRKKELTDKKKKKTEADLEELRWIDFRLGLYWDNKIGLYIPSDNIEKCLQEGAAKSRLGKQSEAACFVTETQIPIWLTNPKTGEIEEIKAKSPEQLYKDPRYIFRRPVRIPPRTGARMMTLRPMLPTGWVLEFDIEFDERLINAKDVGKALITAGTIVGLGIWRPKFGQFVVEILN